jgi:hypothetical protein
MNQGLLNRYKAQLEAIKKHLDANMDQLTQEEIDGFLDRIDFLLGMIEILENS